MEQRNGSQIDFRLGRVGIDRPVRGVRLQVKLCKFGPELLPARLNRRPFWRQGKEITVAMVLNCFEAPLEGLLA